MKITSRGIVSALFILLLPDLLHAQTSRYFAEPLVWVGPSPPNETESLLLADILERGKEQGEYEATTELEEFLTELPDSRWSASLRSIWAITIVCGDGIRGRLNTGELHGRRHEILSQALVAGLPIIH